MKNAIQIPRILVPDRDPEKWSVIACDQFTSDREYWKRVEQTVGDAPSTLRMILPEAYLGENDEERIEEIHETMYTAMEEGWVRKLERGIVLTARTTSSGIRRGIIACVDLEEYTYEPGVSALVRSSEEVVKDRLPARVALRKGALLEFPHAIVFYQDKSDKLMKWLKNADWDQLYDFDLMEGGGHLTGWFIPMPDAAGAVSGLYSRGEPCFAVADGNHSLAAAKAYWEELKPTLTNREKEIHPARYALCEFVNIYDPAVEFFPIYRLVKGVDRETFVSYFTSHIKCKVDGGLLTPSAKGSVVDIISKTDELIEQYIKVNTGKVDYIHGLEELRKNIDEDAVGILVPALRKQDFFPALKGGRNLPKKTFSIGEGIDKRYYMEGREISYD